MRSCSLLPLIYVVATPTSGTLAWAEDGKAIDPCDGRREGHQQFAGACLPDDMVTFLKCVEALGGNRVTIVKEKSSGSESDLKIQFQGMGEGFVLKGSAGGEFIMDGVQQFQESLMEIYGYSAVKACFEMIDRIRGRQAAGRGQSTKALPQSSSRRSSSVRFETCDGKSIECRYYGLCTKVGGECRAMTNEECRRSRDCDLLGHCTARGGQCIAETDKDCTKGACEDRCFQLKESIDICRMQCGRSACRDEGYCVHEGSECKAKPCVDTGGCEWHGLCVGRDGECIADEKNTQQRNYCESSKVCHQYGRCTPISNSCSVQTNADCEQSDHCTIRGRCTAHGGLCLATRDEECLKSAECNAKGRCKESNGVCIAKKPEDCKRVPGCSAGNGCSVQYGECALRPKKHIAFLVKDLDNPFFIEMKRVIDRYRKILGDEFEIEFGASHSEQDSETQVRYLRSYIERDFDAICITPIPSPALFGLLSYQHSRAIQNIIVVDTPLNQLYLGYQPIEIVPDNYRGGRAAGEFVRHHLSSSGAKKRVLLLEGDLNHENARQRRDGFMDALKGAHVVVDEVPAFGSREMARSIVQRKGGIDLAKYYGAVFATNDQMAVGASDGVRCGNRRRPLIVGFDLTAAARREMERGCMDASVAQDPGRMAETALDCAIEIARDHKPGSKCSDSAGPVDLIVGKAKGQRQLAAR